MDCVSSFCYDCYLVCFDSELLRVGVLGEIDVEAIVIATGETVLDNIDIGPDKHGRSVLR